MILVRDVFRLKFGKARDALALWKQMADAARRTGQMQAPRVMTDLVGPYYTLVMETTAADLSAWESEMRKELGDPAFHEIYQKFTPLVESGYREIFNIHEM